MHEVQHQTNITSITHSIVIIRFLSYSFEEEITVSIFISKYLNQLNIIRFMHISKYMFSSIEYNLIFKLFSILELFNAYFFLCDYVENLLKMFPQT